MIGRTLIRPARSRSFSILSFLNRFAWILGMFLNDSRCFIVLSFDSRSRSLSFSATAQWDRLCTTYAQDPFLSYLASLMPVLKNPAKDHEVLLFTVLLREERPIHFNHCRKRQQHHK